MAETIDVDVHEAASAPAGVRNAAVELFTRGYRQGNVAYLEKSFRVLRNVSIAYVDGEPVGFALGETRVMPLPRLGDQVVAMAGICCVDRRFRRRGLFGRLEVAALGAGSPRTLGQRGLSAGRMAHPASMRGLRMVPSVVPKPGVRPTAWQGEVGAVVAAAYGCSDFDRETFVVRGSGVPTGYPDLDIDVDPDEWLVFEPVDRDRGDALLAIAWGPTAPDGW